MSTLGSTLQGRHAIVTGAARGIGAAIVRVLAAEGAAVTLLGRQRDALQRVASELPGGPHGVVVADVSDAAQVQAAFDEARAARGPIAILVNNAGQAESAPFMKTSAELWQRMLAVNLTGSFVCAQAALPDMLKAGSGRIVNIASTAGQKGYAYVSAYVAAKHGVIGLTKTLALEGAEFGITCNAICPGYVWTPLVENQIDDTAKARGISREEVIRDVLLAAQPNKRFAEVEELGALAVFLSGPGGRSITGTALPVDGGWTAH